VARECELLPELAPTPEEDRHPEAAALGHLAAQRICSVLTLDIPTGWQPRLLADGKEIDGSAPRARDADAESARRTRAAARSWTERFAVRGLRVLDLAKQFWRL